MNWIHLVQDRNKWTVIVDMAMNPSVSVKYCEIAE